MLKVGAKRPLPDVIDRSRPEIRAERITIADKTTELRYGNDRRRVGVRRRAPASLGQTRFKLFNPLFELRKAPEYHRRLPPSRLGIPG